MNTSQKRVDFLENLDMNRQRLIEMAKASGFDPHDMSDDFTCNLENIESLAVAILLEVAKEYACTCQKLKKLLGAE